MRDNSLEVESTEKDGVKLTISYDTLAGSPREDDGNMVRLICFHDDYIIGDKHDYRLSDFEDGRALEKQLRKDYDIVHIEQVRMYEHSNISISTSKGYPYNDPWDSSFVGFAFIDKAKIRENYGVKRVTKKQVERAMKEFESEIELYNEYLQGEVFYFSLDRVKDCGCVAEHIDSCGGFIGRDWKNNGMMDNMSKEYWPLLEALS